MFDPFFPLLIVLAALAFVALLWISGRLSKGELPRRLSIPAIVLLWLVFATGAIYTAWPLLFVGRPSITMYVQLPGSVAPGSFNESLAAILRKQGFDPDVTSISSPEDPENPMYLLEARSVFTRIWSETALMSREEATACGYRLSKEDIFGNDERQYQISVTSVPFFPDRTRATFTALKQQLLQNGYGVSPKQLPCPIVPRT